MNDFFDWLHDAAERALPMVCAFGLGVLIALHAADAEIDSLRTAVVALADQVEHTRIACGAQPDPDAVSAALAAHLTEAQP
ncbi:MAG: hypothetical protein RBT67_07540 [Thauera sp.]|jgi:hypothetical protein|nr:hypothetical protein [Thauera sp.]